VHFPITYHKEFMETKDVPNKKAHPNRVSKRNITMYVSYPQVQHTYQILPQSVIPTQLKFLLMLNYHHKLSLLFSQHFHNRYVDSMLSLALKNHLGTCQSSLY